MDFESLISCFEIERMTRTENIGAVSPTVTSVDAAGATRSTIDEDTLIALLFGCALLRFESVSRQERS